MPECCKGNATSLERLSCENELLIGDICLLSEYWICKECDLCPVRDIEVAIDWFRAVMWGAIKLSNSPVVAHVSFQVRQNLLIRGYAVLGHFLVTRC